MRTEICVIKYYLKNYNGRIIKSIVSDTPVGVLTDDNVLHLMTAGNMMQVKIIELMVTIFLYG